MPKEKIHPELFKGANRKFTPPRSSIIAGKRNDSTKTPTQEKRREQKQKSAQKKIQAKLKELGINTSDLIIQVRTV